MISHSSPICSRKSPLRSLYRRISIAKSEVSAANIGPVTFCRFSLDSHLLNTGTGESTNTPPTSNSTARKVLPGGIRKIEQQSMIDWSQNIEHANHTPDHTAYHSSGSSTAGEKHHHHPHYKHSLLRAAPRVISRSICC